MTEPMTDGVDFEIVFKDRVTEEDRTILDEALANHTSSLFGTVAAGGLTFMAKTGSEVVGGVTGYWGSFGWLYIDQLWVSSDKRGQGLGSRLLTLIENEAVKLGCLNAHLNTMSFQAPEFYRRHGYVVFGELEDFPVGHTRLFLRKRLV